MKSIARLRVWWWKWRFAEAMLSKVGRARTAVVIRFCEACAEDAWAWNYNVYNKGELENALFITPSSLVLRMTSGTLSSFRVPA